MSNREYKEALRQQRNQDSSSIYKTKEQSLDGSPDYKSSSSSSSTPGDSYPPNIPLHNESPKNISTTLQPPSSHAHVAFKSPVHQYNGEQASSPVKQLDTPTVKKPVLKVTPSRNSNATYHSPTHLNVNGNHKTVEITTTVTKEYSVYMKPASPTKSSSNTTGGSYNNGLSRQQQSANNNTQATSTPKPSR